MFNLKQELAIHHIDLSSTMEQQLELFYQRLVEWNEKMNLTGITERDAVYEKHFYDSLALGFFHPLTHQTLCDVGAGAGFPSLPLQIVFPNLQVTVVDSLAKRMKFIEAMKDELKLQSLSLVVSRAETYNVGREHFDLVTARAVAPLRILLELLTPLAKVGGYVVAYKGSDGESELKDAKNALKVLGLVLEKTYEFTLPNEKSVRNLFFFKKVSLTSMKYPRPFAKIQASPL